jgi:hypothetical protein
VWREAEKLIGEDGALQMVDPLHVIETVMRYFYSLAQTGRKANAPLDEVRKCFREAAQLAALAAPYRHARLSAVKHIEQGDTIEALALTPRPRNCGPSWPSASRCCGIKATSILRHYRRQSQRPAPD